MRAVDDCRDLLASDENVARIRRSVYDAWARIHIDAARRFPEVRRFRNNVRYVAQQSLRTLREQDGVQAAEAWITGRIAEFDGTDEFSDLVLAIQGYFEQTVSELVKSQDYDAALQTIDRGVELIGPDKVVRAARIACDQWASRLSDQGRWSEAAAVYRRGLERFPKDYHLGRNAIAIWNSWATVYMDNQDWDTASEVYERALEQFPDNRTLQNNLRYCRQEKDKTQK